MSDPAGRDATDMPAPSEIVVSRGARDGDWIVTIHGEIDVATSPALHETLDDVLARDAHLVTLDLTRLTFIDSSGLGVLVGAHKQLRQAGGDTIVLRGMQEPVRRVFEITGLTKLFTVET